LIVAMTTLHVAGARPSRWTQDLLALAQWLLVVGFVVAGLLLGRHVWPTWTPPAPPPPSALSLLMQFAGSLFYVAFAFSGWNTCAYAAGEFAHPRRDVPRAMLIGCALVALVYLAINWVFVANLTPEEARVALDYETNRVTLGHVVARQLAGPAGGAAMSVLAILAFVASMSAMTFAGPRVYAAMAADGFLPRALAGRRGRPPAASVMLQSALALLILWTHSLRQALVSVSAIVVLFSGLTALCVFRLRPVASRGARACAALYASMAAWMLWFGLRGALHLVGWIALIAIAALAGYLLSSRSPSRRRPWPA
jgi:APA family basic amino acid/polyamine antiporter